MFQIYRSEDQFQIDMLEDEIESLRRDNELLRDKNLKLKKALNTVSSDKMKPLKVGDQFLYGYEDKINVKWTIIYAINDDWGIAWRPGKDWEGKYMPSLSAIRLKTDMCLMKDITNE